MGEWAGGWRGSGGNANDGERQMKPLLLAQPLTSCCATWLLTGRGVVLAVGNPCSKERDWTEGMREGSNVSLYTFLQFEFF